MLTNSCKFCDTSKHPDNADIHKDTCNTNLTLVWGPNSSASFFQGWSYSKNICPSRGYAGSLLHTHTHTTWTFLHFKIFHHSFYFYDKMCMVTLPVSIAHLICTVVHSHDGFFVIDAGQHEYDWCIGDNKIQVVLGEVKIDRLKWFVKNVLSVKKCLCTLSKHFTYYVKKALAGIYCVEQLINVILGKNRNTKHTENK